MACVFSQTGIIIHRIDSELLCLSRSDLHYDSVFANVLIYGIILDSQVKLIRRTRNSTNIRNSKSLPPMSIRAERKSCWMKNRKRKTSLHCPFKRFCEQNRRRNWKLRPPCDKPRPFDITCTDLKESLAGVFELSVSRK
jgi:hypothetical protein